MGCLRNSSPMELDMKYGLNHTPKSAQMGEIGKNGQDHGELDVTKLHPLSPEVFSGQATINIGTIGHVAHGKSTVVKALTGLQTGRFRSEKERNQTIKLGYANAKIYKCENKWCPRPFCYSVHGSSKEDRPPCEAPGCKGHKMKLMRHVSFVDCPGHEKYMATMLSGAGVMDGALLVAAANENFPQPQTAEHLAAADILGLEDVIILQNKVDLAKQEAVMKQYGDIKSYCQGTVASDAPVIPICAAFKLNMDVLCEYIVNKISVPERDFISPPQMTIIRSFDVNKPGARIHEIQGGVLGRSIHKGIFKLNQVVEIRPGLILTDKEGSQKCCPIFSRIVSLKAERNELQFAVPGGLIGVGTTLDPSLTRADRLVGQMVGEVGSLPDVYIKLEVKYFLLKRLIGAEAKEKAMPEQVVKRAKRKAKWLVGIEGKGKATEDKVVKPAEGEKLLLNIGSMRTEARVTAAGNGSVRLKLRTGVCTNKGEKIALSRLVDDHWRLIGWGLIQGGSALEVDACPSELKRTAGC